MCVFLVFVCTRRLAWRFRSLCFLGTSLYMQLHLHVCYDRCVSKIVRRLHSYVNIVKENLLVSLLFWIYRINKYKYCSFRLVSAGMLAIDTGQLLDLSKVKNEFEEMRNTHTRARKRKVLWPFIFQCLTVSFGAFPNVVDVVFIWIFFARASAFGMVLFYTVETLYYANDDTRWIKRWLLTRPFYTRRVSPKKTN